jgi:hypothetical protein
VKIFAFWSSNVSTSLPTSFEIDELSPKSKGFDVSWTASTNVVSYTVTTYLTDLSTVVAAYTGIVTESHVVDNDTDYTNGNQYYLKVSAINADGETAWSSGFQFFQPVALPSSFALATLIESTSGFALTWTGALGASDYIVSVYDAPAGTLLFESDSLTTTFYTQTSLDAGVTYYVTVSALSNSGSVVWDDGYYAITVLDVPTSFSSLALDYDDSGFSLSWGGSTFANYYSVLVFSGDDSIATYTSNDTSFSVSGDALLINGEEYTLKVIAHGNAGSTDWSDGLLSFTPNPTPIPTPFEMLAMAPRFKGFIASWAASTNVDEYSIIVYASDQVTVIDTISGLTLTSYAIEDGVLDNGTLYYLAVQAINSDGTRQWSDGKIAFTPLLGNVPVSFSKTSAIARDQGFYAGWGIAYGATTYSVEVYDGGYSLVKSFDGITDTYLEVISDGDLSNGTTYYLKVIAQNYGGETYWTGEFHSVTPTSLPAPFPFAAVEVFPEYEGVYASWEASENASDYNVNIYSDSNGPLVTRFIGVGATDYNITSDSSLTNGLTYAIEVVATNATSSLAWSNGRVDFVPNIPTPSAFSPISVTGADEGFSASWDGSVSADNYTLDVFSDSGLGSLVDTFSTSSPYFDVVSTTTLANYTPYWLLVTATNVYSQSAQWSGGGVEFTPEPLPAPTSFSMVETISASGGFDTSWGVSANATDYTVSIYDYSLAPVKDFTGITDTSLSVSGDPSITNGDTFYLEVAANNISGSAIWVDGQVEFYPNPLPITFSAISISGVNQGFSATWSASTYATSYTVDIYAADGVTLIDTYATASLSTSYSSASLTNFTLFYLRITATNVYGSKVWTDNLVPFTPLP